MYFKSVTSQNNSVQRHRNVETFEKKKKKVGISTKASVIFLEQT